MPPHKIDEKCPHDKPVVALELDSCAIGWHECYPDELLVRIPGTLYVFLQPPNTLLDMLVEFLAAIKAKMDP